jgi:ankyrin repeat protein
MVSVCDAISKGDHLALPALVQSGADVNERGKHGCTLLLWSWCNGYPRAFEALLELGADPHATIDSDIAVDVGGNRLTLTKGSSVAAIAVRFSRIQPEFLEKVVQYLRDANQRDAEGRTLFHCLMASADDQPIVRQWLDAKYRDPVALKQMREHLAYLDKAKLVQTTAFALLYQAGGLSMNKAPKR